MLNQAIIKSLFESPTYFNKTIHHLTPELFDNDAQGVVVRKIKDYSELYKRQPKWADIKLLIKNDLNLNEGVTDEAIEFIDSCKGAEEVADDMLITESENWGKLRSLENAIMDSLKIMQDPKSNKGIIEDIIKQALRFGFAQTLGHDYFRDAPTQYEYYTTQDEVMPTEVESMNQSLGGGYRRKAIYVYMGRTNIGKTLWMCHEAAALMRKGYNVLYVSAEMSEEMIRTRLDANLLEFMTDELGMQLDKKEYFKKVRELYDKTTGRLKIKEYPSGTASANTIRALINDYKLKEGFVPDVIILDYLNIFASYRLPASAISNQYLYVKSVTEEMRGLGASFENGGFNCAVISATQTNRGGSEAGVDTGMEDIADSFGLPMTADWMGAIIQNPELFKLCKYLLKVIKTRFGANNYEIYTVGVNRSHMKLHQLAESEQELPLHVKDQLKVEEATRYKKKNAEATEDVLARFTFEE